MKLIGRHRPISVAVSEHNIELTEFVSILFKEHRRAQLNGKPREKSM